MMTKYCHFSCALACIALLVMGVSCDYVGRPLKTDVGDESVTPEKHTDGETHSGGPGVPDTRAVGEEPRKDNGEAAAHVAFKPVSTAAAAAEPRPDPPPPVEIQAMELAAKELATNLRLNQERDSAKRAELEREMLQLRRQRQTLYQSHVKGK